MSANEPPPVRTARPAAPTQKRKKISGTEGLTILDIQNAVAQGAKFVSFQYCISILVMSFKRSSPIMFLKPGENAFIKGAPYSLISLFAGWWGIPWGPIWTVMTISVNCGGGKDVTREVLASVAPSVMAGKATPGSAPPLPTVTVLPPK